jgi:cardiolipin synthase
MNAANFVTCVRIVLTPVFGVLWWRGKYGAALAVFAAAGLSDLLDGFLARALNQKTKLGQFLDPAADKLMVLCGYVTAVVVHAVPGWIAALVIGRDVLQALSAGAFYLFARDKLGPERWRPTRLGKYSTLIQVFAVGMALLADATERAALAPYVAALVLTAAVLTVVAAAQYLARAAMALSGKLPEGGSAA